MSTALFQVAVALLALVVGYLALKAAQSLGGAPPLHRVSWEITGVVFLLGGLSSVIQNGWALAAVVAGRGSLVWNTYLFWSPLGDYGRTLAKAMLGLLLFLVPFASDSFLARARRVALVSTLLMFTLGAVAGLVEGPLQLKGHFSNYSIFETLELVLFLAALFNAVRTSSMDRLLWGFTSLYAARQALNALSYAAVALSGEQHWAPSGQHIHVIGIFCYVAMSYLAYRRIRLARSGVQVPGMFDLPPARQASLLH